MMNLLTEAEIYQNLKSNMPSIGFCSRDKRIIAAQTVCYHAQELINNGRAEEDLVVSALALLYNQYKPFSKAMIAIALHAPKFPIGSVDKLCQQFTHEICIANNLPTFKWFRRVP